MSDQLRAGEIDMDLTIAEAKALARRVVARHLADTEGWLSWEDYPNLTELAIVQLVEAVEALGQDAEHDADAHDRCENLDSMLLLERATP